MKQIPTQTDAEGCAFTIVARYEGRANLKCMTSGAGYYPATGVIEIYEEGYSMEYGKDGRCEDNLVNL